MNLSDAVDGYLLFKATRASAETIKTDSVLLDQFLHWRGECDVKHVTSEDIRCYLDHHKERGLSPHTIQRHHATVSALYSWLSSSEIALVEGNPARAVPPTKLPKLKPKALKTEDIKSLLAAAEQGRCRRRDKALILFLLDTGARASEVTGLQNADADFKAGRAKVNGKGDKERFVYLGKRALSALWLYVKDERPEAALVGDDHLFLTDEGYPLDRHSLRRIVYRLADRAGLKASPHQFRHTSAIEHLRHGMDLLSLQRLLGHESLEITRGYLTALDDEDTERAAKRTSPSDNWRL